MESNFAKNLKQIRVMNGLSQKELAEKLNVSFKTISHWESGYSEPNLFQLIELKKALSVSYEDLLD